MICSRIIPHPKQWTTLLTACLLLSSHHALALDQAAQEKIRTTLQAKAPEIIEVKLNYDPANVKFDIVDMRNSMVEIDGMRFCAFRFKTGKKVHQLTWCFRIPPGLQDLNIIPKSGTMHGFTRFRRFSLQNNDLHAWGSLGDSFHVQSLPSTHFDPNSEYLIWFRIDEAAASAINLSLNMTDVPDGSPFSAVFPNIRIQ
jgi:hypothetical protein